MDLQLFYTLSFGLIGLLFGSFANVCVHRIPLGESVVSPASHCPNCKQNIAWYDNIPVLSWLLLGRKCRFCALPIVWRYPFLELCMGLTWATLAWCYPPTPYPSLFLMQALLLVSLLWVLTLIDLETFLLPDALTFPGIVLGLLFAWQSGYVLDALIGAVAGYAVFWLVAWLFWRVTGREGMGQGDFKLLAMLGAFMGWQALPFVVLLSSVTGVVIGSIGLLLAKRGLRAEIPYGPYLAAAGLIWFFWGEPILWWYQGWIGLQ
ncbi:MAG: A24 family peptidase [Mariprofundaceae bacterium]|nr:A24 family peptidase [Mariprofundaceae bacterium]